MELRMLKVKEIEPNPFQPRVTFDEEKLKELRDSIKELGLLAPVIVRRHDGAFQLVAGERRWRAAQEAGLEEIPAIIREADDFESLLESLSENLHREDLTSLERENAIYELWERGRKEGRVKSYEDLAKKLGLDSSTISNTILARKYREKERISPRVSTSVIIDTAGLEEKERVQLIRRVERGEIKAREVREYKKAIQESSEPVKRALLETGSKLTPQEAKIIEIRLPGLFEKEQAIARVQREEAPDVGMVIETTAELAQRRPKETVTELEIITDEYQMLDGTTRGLVRRVGDGEIIERYEEFPPPQNQTDIVCPHFLMLKWASGCPFNCAWCYLQSQEDGMERRIKDFSEVEFHLKRFLEVVHPPEVLNTGELTDSLMHDLLPDCEGEPFSRFIIELFKAQDRHKVLFLSKSIDIQGLLQAHGQDCTIVSFSLNAAPVAERWEKAPAVEARIQAAQRLHRAGYTTRIRIGPLVPIGGWKDHYRRLIDDLFKAFVPERITLGALWGDERTIAKATDKSWTEYLTERSDRGQEIAFEARYAMYSTLINYLREEYGYTDVALCRETLGMWVKLGMDYRNIRCNCIW
jgi:ParB/RepB/Spo0J family partition protein